MVCLIVRLRMTDARSAARPTGTVEMAAASSRARRKFAIGIVRPGGGDSDGPILPSFRKRCAVIIATAPPVEA